MTLILILVIAPFFMVTLCFAVEVFCGLKPLRQFQFSGGPNVSAVIIVPAHDEAVILGERLAALMHAARGYARILLVADNCGDSTADVARECGAEVIERFDNERRGKGFALDFARNYLDTDPPEIVLIIDADCRTDANSVERLIEICAASRSPCQATNLQAPSLQASPAVQLSTFAFYIKNVVRQRGLVRLAGRAHLVGTGMAIPWPIFRQANLATGDIVEDLKLGQELADAGHAPIFVEDAAVWSDAETDANTLSQRQRWEGGFLANAIRSGPSMFGRSLLRGNVRGLWAAINIMIPPFGLLLLVDSLLLAAAIAITLSAGAQFWPASLLTVALAIAAMALVLAWRGGGRRYVTVGGLARMPLYLAWKIPMYLGFARAGRPRDWVRTSRGLDG